MIERQTIDGREATIAYLTAAFEPAGKDDAALVKVIFDDGEQMFLVPAEEGIAEDAEWDEGKHKRDDDGKFSETGGSGSSSSAATAPAGGGPLKSKKAIAGELLAKGVTTKQMLEALGWPSISMPAMARALNMNLEKVKGEGGTTIYRGTLIEPEAEPEAKEPAQETKFPEGTSKKDIARQLLEKGTTSGEMLKALAWPTISMPAMAKALHLNLEKAKKDGVTIYTGTPFSAEQMEEVERHRAERRAQRGPSGPQSQPEET